MNCHETQELLHAYLDGELDVVSDVALTHHLDECRSVRRPITASRRYGLPSGRALWRFPRAFTAAHSVRRAPCQPDRHTRPHVGLAVAAGRRRVRRWRAAHVGCRVAPTGPAQKTSSRRRSSPGTRAR